MSGIYVRAVTAQATLHCDICSARFSTDTYRYISSFDASDRLGEAWNSGWRVFAAGRGHRTYCPEHGPSVTMRQLYPKASTDGAS